MFVVFGFFALFIKIGKPMSAVPLLFIFVICISALVGNLVANLYSEPMNRLLRRRIGQAGESMDSLVNEPNPESAMKAPIG
jgi:hypothetical protein